MPSAGRTAPARNDSGAGERGTAVPSSALNRTIKSVADLYAEAGITLSPSRAARLASRSLRARAWQTDLDASLAALLPPDYPDPTGETAVWNVMAAGGAR